MNLRAERNNRNASAIMNHPNPVHSTASPRDRPDNRLEKHEPEVKNPLTGIWVHSFSLLLPQPNHGPVPQFPLTSALRACDSNALTCGLAAAVLARLMSLLLNVNLFLCYQKLPENSSENPPPRFDRSELVERLLACVPLPSPPSLRL
jgi:hypothetical protein